MCLNNFFVYLSDLIVYLSFVFFFFQAEDGIRDAQESRGLGDVYKRQVQAILALGAGNVAGEAGVDLVELRPYVPQPPGLPASGGSGRGLLEVEHCPAQSGPAATVSYTHLRAHETPEHLVC